MKSHNLQQGLALGEAWERRVEKLLRLVYEDLRPASMDEQREGIDRVGTVKGSGVVHRIEIKTDLRGHQTGNAFVETVAYDKPVHKLGWVYTSQADLLLYLVPGIPRLYLFRPTDLRGQIDGWKARYPTTSVLNRGYRTFGVCVPLGEFGKVAIATSTEKHGAQTP